jgi:hypothetical protein
MKRVPPVLAFALIALAVLALLLPLLAAVLEPAPETSTSAAETQPSPGRHAELERLEAQVQRLQWRLAERKTIEAEMAAFRADEGASDTSSIAAGPVLSPEQAQHQEKIMWQQRLTEFEAEPVDPAWGAQVQDRLLVVLRPLAEQLSGRVTGLECRSSRCKATVDWEAGVLPSIENATRLMLETIPATRRCARHVRVADPDNRDATTLIIECG